MKIVDSSRQALIELLILPFDSSNPQQATHCVWHSIYRRDFLVKNNITFPSRLKYITEDRLFNLLVVLCNPKIVHKDNVYYNWCLNPSSTSNTDVENIAIRRINLLYFITDRLESDGMLISCKYVLFEHISNELRNRIKCYKALPRTEKTRFARKLKELGYNFGTAKTYLRLLSRKRLRIFLFLLDILYLHRT